MSAKQNFTVFENDTYCASNCIKVNNTFFIVVLYVFGSLIVILNVPSLVMVIVTFIRKLKLKYIHILSLSFTDAIIGVSWLLITNTLRGTKMSFADCAIRAYLLCVTFMASMFQVLGICIERNMVICLQSRFFMSPKKNKMFIIIMSWGLAILLSSIVSAVTVRSYNDARVCSFDSLFQAQKYTAYGTLGIIFAITQVGVVVAMTILLVFLNQHQKKMKKLKVHKIKKSNIKLCTTIGIIAVLFFAVNTPLTVVYLLDGFYTGVSSSRIIRNSSFLFAGINSMINPFIYLFEIKYLQDLIRNSVNKICSCISANQENTSSGS